MANKPLLHQESTVLHEYYLRSSWLMYYDNTDFISKPK